jgi:tetratricopeptide (TPR) repeat protein
MVDELVLKIKPNLEMTAVEVANDIDGRSYRVMTSSLEAYNYYAQGIKFSSALKWQEGIEMLEKAVKIDPEFAMAYRHLGAWHSNLRNWTEQRKNLDRALELANRLDLPPREKLNIEGYARTDLKGRLDAFTRLLELYPDDYVGNVQLGMIYLMRFEDFEKAAGHFEVSVRNKVENLIPYDNLAYTYCRVGEHAKAENVLKEYISDFPGSPGLAEAHHLLSRVYTVEAKYKLALAEAEKALRLDPSPSDELLRKKAYPPSSSFYATGFIRFSEHKACLRKPRTSFGRESGLPKKTTCPYWILCIC